MSVTIYLKVALMAEPHWYSVNRSFKVLGKARLDFPLITSQCGPRAFGNIHREWTLACYMYRKGRTSWLNPLDCKLTTFGHRGFNMRDKYRCLLYSVCLANSDSDLVIQTQKSLLKCICLSKMRRIYVCIWTVFIKQKMKPNLFIMG